MNSKTPRLKNWSIHTDSGEYATRDIIIKAVFDRTGGVPRLQDEHYFLVGNRFVPGEDSSIVISPGLLKVERVGIREIAITTDKYHEYILSFNDVESEWRELINR